MGKKIVIKCEGAAVIPLEHLTEFQGELKTLSVESYEKLRKEILKLGFSEPVSVWRQKKGKLVTHHILNGHQRVRVIRKMVSEEGFSCDGLPVSLIEASSLREAKEKVLALTSQYGVMTNDGLYEFITNAGIDAEELERFSFPEINLDDFKVEYGDLVNEDQKPPEKDGGVFDRTSDQYSESLIKQIVLFYEKDRYEEILRKLELLRGKSKALDFSEVVGALIDEAAGA